ncbi:hypothetical protein AAFF_G00137730 [Aldrovandia affinis]|uniref:Uncharacterized protein n=1 Tax=Aldrovandia affinis TaxID=143900 RepID=A0AAD7X3M8_9TELE|nr:hypothetical protein AAFF_G00137730 [Aldrovandia affinis]
MQNWVGQGPNESPTRHPSGVTPPVAVVTSLPDLAETLRDTASLSQSEQQHSAHSTKDVSELRSVQPLSSPQADLEFRTPSEEVAPPIGQSPTDDQLDCRSSLTEPEDRDPTPVSRLRPKTTPPSPSCLLTSLGTAPNSPPLRPPLQRAALSPHHPATPLSHRPPPLHPRSLSCTPVPLLPCPRVQPTPRLLPLRTSRPVIPLSSYPILY